MDRRMLDIITSVLRPEELPRLQQLIGALEHGQRPSSRQLFSSTHSKRSTFWPLVAVYVICCKRPGHWSTFELCRRFWSCWRCLPEDAKCGRASKGAHELISRTLHFANTSYRSVFDLLHSKSTSPAIIDPESGKAITHKALARLITSFSVPFQQDNGKPVVAISLPNGPLLATVLLATATYFTAAPVAYGNGVGPEQFKRDVLQSGSHFIIAFSADVQRLQLRDAWLEQAGIKVLLVELRDDLFSFKDVSGEILNHSAWPRPQCNQAGDIAVLLFTSGTSGAKKLVPLHLESLVTGVAMVQSSWNLTTNSRCLNQMPLNHVGGIVRNLFAPIMSGGSVICCSSFDANAFWDVVDDLAPTWYYASPTMHQCILDAVKDRPESVERSKITLICNAAGGLLPSLAVQLRNTFSRRGAPCTVLPSYGMTECMPISTPPLTYKLERTGTSGISVGPEIAILDANDKRLPPDQIGRIAVRGAPIFAGYLKDGRLDRSCFGKDGWFDTGDMGYLDKEDYLYITGRSKEVINRGGELISPFEVEDAILAAAKNPVSPIFGKIVKALAFSVSHDVLQEVVGLVVVTPPNSKRPCLKTIQDAVKSSLAAVKLPVLLVYMNDDLPTNNNKVLRIRLAERLSIPTLSDSTPSSQRYYEAICPAANTPLTVGIRSRRLATSTGTLRTICVTRIPQSLDFYILTVAAEIQPQLWLAPKRHDDAANAWTETTCEKLMTYLHTTLNAYDIPSQIHCSKQPFARRTDGAIDELTLAKTNAPPTTIREGMNQAETKIIVAFAESLTLPAHTLNVASDFFQLGGDSMKAGRLLSLLRKSFSTRITIDVLFANSSVQALTKLLADKEKTTERHTRQGQSDFSGLTKSLPGCTKTHSSTRLSLMILQLLPICMIAPLRRALTWSIFIYCLTYSQELVTSDYLPGRFLNLITSLLIGKTVSETFAPIVAIILKWLVIGRYKEGLYPMWGGYHTRWWMVQKILSIGGIGIYGHFAFTRLLYYRCLGARIGRNVTIDKDAKLGEYDLITIGDGAVLDACTVRPFAVERNTSMYLGRIRIGADSSVGLASIVAAGTTVPTSACIGPNSSSWEVSDADESNRDLSISKIPKPQWALQWLLGFPLFVFASFVGAIPWMGGLLPLVLNEPKQDASDMLRETIIWFSSPQRVVFHYVALGCNAALGPIFFFLIVVAIKKTLDACNGGPIRSGPAARKSQFDRLRMDLFRTLMPDKRFHNLTGLFGTHYEATSFFARMLGAKVGKHVYWPGKGPTTQDFDMLDVGESVVFGSRSFIVTSDGIGTKPVKIGAGAMVADRVILLPGSELGKNTIMGSGALTQRNKLYPANTTWVGSKKNDAVCLRAEVSNEALPAISKHRFEQYRDTVNTMDTLDAQISMYSYADDIGSPSKTPTISRKGSMYTVKSLDDDEEYILKDIDEKHTKQHIVMIRMMNNSSDSIIEQEQSSPFGRAFYQGLAPYRVWSQLTIACYSTFITIFTAVFWNIHSIGAIQVVAWIYRQERYEEGFLRVRAARPLFIYAFFTALIAIIMAVQILFALGTIIAAKWILMGRRQQGNYDWDKSSYCQRWQLLLKIESLRQKCYGGHGILGLLTGTNWIVLYFRALGANIGKDCALFASGTPSLYFTEPDLLTLGDRVSVDDASLVCHINTRGKFDLNPLCVGNRSVLRTGSRLLSGARMEADSCLLEHTLVMAGDIVDTETAMQGWPGEEFMGNRLPTMKVAYHWETA